MKQIHDFNGRTIQGTFVEDGLVRVYFTDGSYMEVSNEDEAPLKVWDMQEAK